MGSRGLNITTENIVLLIHKLTITFIFNSDNFGLAMASAPKTIDKVREAIERTGDKKGASVVAIKNYILATWPDTNPTQLKSHLKKAIEKGFEKGLFKRSKTSEVQGPGLTGSIMLNKDFIAAEAKAKASKEKLAEKKAEKKEKASTTVKKTSKKEKSANRSKSRSKSRSSSQSPVKKATKKTAEKTAKPKTTKTDAKSKSKAKSPKKAPKAMAAKKKILQSKGGVSTPKRQLKPQARPRRQQQNDLIR